ncbi:FAD dependent oxidoreductase [Stachybotrys elegans]|uniref:FAD dependent oxidoreductase n=1 Tax=Stachybotrys elegans TaxID=80388 RepID=A0A8K0SH43_9HYPO|nr:FAD dependent oxidoreductase [Stachybotrys elegans]
MSSTHQGRGQPAVVVVGAGIIGLTCALRLEDSIKNLSPQAKPLVLLVAKEWPTSIPGVPLGHSVDYASMWAGAHVRPIPATTPQLKREAKWLKQTVAELGRQVDAQPWLGITRTPGIEFLEAPDEGYRLQNHESFSQESGLPGFRILTPSELPKDVVLGFEYETYCINAPVYCRSLLRKFVLQGGKTVNRTLASEWEIFSLPFDVKFVINASGNGFGKDPKCFPIRGQTVVTDLEPAMKTVTRQLKDGSWSFIIPRFFHGGTIVGGTKELGDWRHEPDMATRNRLLKNGQTLVSHATGQSTLNGQADRRTLGVIADVVGRRPAREGGMRIELETRTVTSRPGEEREAHTIHAYGAGGRGYEIGWGVADEVMELAAPFLEGLRSGAKL